MRPNPLISLVPILVLVGMMAITISLFGADSLGGGTQIALIISSAACVVISMAVYKRSWKTLEDGIVKMISSSAVSICILLVIGMMSGSWMVSGVVPTMIYYGIQIMSPTFFLVCTCIICALVSLMTGSSWTTVATIGVALIGIGSALGVSEAWTAGAIISGAYFGDKISPLSDTTILASTTAEVNLFTHIHYMLRTTVPSMIITLLIFLVAGFMFQTSGNVQVSEYLDGLSSSFNISLWTLIVPIVTGLLIAKRVPSLLTLVVSALLAGVMSVVLQREVLMEIVGGDGSVMDIIKGVMITFYGSTNVETGSDAVNELVSTSGMAGMMDTIWLILTAMCFGGVMVASGMVQSIASVIVNSVRGTTSMVAANAATGFMSNVLTCDQYVSIILSNSMFRDVYEKTGHESRLLSRTTEDSTTVTSVLVPWNTCGMTQSTVLGVPTLTYLPFCFFNYISPFMSIFIAAIGWKIVKRGKDKTESDKTNKEKI